MKLTLKEYRDGVGAKDFMKWISNALQEPTLKAAHEAFAAATLKVCDVGEYQRNMAARLEAAAVLRTFYLKKKFAKKQYAQQIRKQSYEQKVVKELVDRAKFGRELLPLHFAYGDGKFASTVRGCEGGTPHARLARKMILDGQYLHKIWEYRTTKRYLSCSTPPLNTYTDPCKFTHPFS